MHTITWKAYHKQAKKIHSNKFKENSIIATKEFQKLQMEYGIFKKVLASYNELQRVRKEQVENERRLRAMYKEMMQSLINKEKTHQLKQDKKS